VRVDSFDEVDMGKLKDPEQLAGAAYYKAALGEPRVVVI
jgi:hypothetical protein